MIDFYLWIVKNKEPFPCQTILNCLQATDPENVMSEVVEMFYFSLLATVSLPLVQILCVSMSCSNKDFLISASSLVLVSAYQL